MKSADESLLGSTNKLSSSRKKEDSPLSTARGGVFEMDVSVSIHPGNIFGESAAPAVQVRRQWLHEPGEQATKSAPYVSAKAASSGDTFDESDSEEEEVLSQSTAERVRSFIADLPEVAAGLDPCPPLVDAHRQLRRDIILLPRRSLHERVLELHEKLHLALDELTMEGDVMMELVSSLACARSKVNDAEESLLVTQMQLAAAEEYGETLAHEKLEALCKLADAKRELATVGARCALLEKQLATLRQHEQEWLAGPGHQASSLTANATRADAATKSMMDRSCGTDEPLPRTLFEAGDSVAASSPYDGTDLRRGTDGVCSASPSSTRASKDVLEGPKPEGRRHSTDTAAWSRERDKLPRRFLDLEGDLTACWSRSPLRSSPHGMYMSRSYTRHAPDASNAATMAEMQSQLSRAHDNEFRLETELALERRKRKELAAAEEKLLSDVVDLSKKLRAREAVGCSARQQRLCDSTMTREQLLEEVVRLRVLVHETSGRRGSFPSGSNASSTPNGTTSRMTTSSGATPVSGTDRQPSSRTPVRREEGGTPALASPRVGLVRANSKVRPASRSNHVRANAIFQALDEAKRWNQQRRSSAQDKPLDLGVTEVLPLRNTPEGSPRKSRYPTEGRSLPRPLTPAKLRQERCVAVSLHPGPT